MRHIRTALKYVSAKLRTGVGRKEFHSFDEALHSCGESYSAADLVRVVASKTGSFRRHPPTQKTVFDLFSLVTSPGDSLRVLDFGGGCGAHYFQAAQESNRRLLWAVVETEAMAAAASAFSSDSLTFHSSISAAVQSLGDPPDIVFSSGAIQYTPRPWEYLTELLAVDARLVCLSRLPVRDGCNSIRIQKSFLSSNGPGPMPSGIRERVVKYPVTLLSREELLSRAKQFGYTVVDSNSNGVTTNYLLRK